jgi:uncharacterized protein YcaQ
LAAQGFDRSRPKRATSKDAARVIRQLGLLQIDYVNVLVPSHYLVLFSRLGSYKRSLLDDLTFRSGAFTEQWAHEASIVPIESWPLLRYRRETHRVRPYPFEALMNRSTEYAELLLEEIRRRGPLTADDVPKPEGELLEVSSDWYRSAQRMVLEAHFGRGLLAVADRKPNFARVFDLAERVIHQDHHGRVVERDEALRQLLLLAVRAHGVGTAADLADYFRMPIRDARPRLLELVHLGAITEVKVEGWREPAYLYPDSARPRKIEANALLSPFDPVVWFRPRALRLFGFDYRIEIFVPEEKRKWGYYVLPFLMGERLAARVDLKADRANRRLQVLSSYLEAGEKPGEVAEALAAELSALAAWLSLESVSVTGRGPLAQALASAVKAVS